MERYFRLLMLCITTMFGIFSISDAQAEEIVSNFAYPLGNQEGQLARSIEQLESEGYGSYAI